MGPLLSDDIWMRRGISMLWDAEALAAVCTPKQVVSLRQFLLLYAAGWPDAHLFCFASAESGRTPRLGSIIPTEVSHEQAAS
jgi:hypothetical protein